MIILTCKKGIIEDYPNISVVIRALNERKALKELLKSLKKQDYPGKVEIIVVDNESTDGTKETAIECGAEVVTIGRQEFSYPRSMNLGIAAASNEIVFLTVAHALPYKRDWLSTGVRELQNKSVAGIYGGCLPNKNASSIEFLCLWLNYFVAPLRSRLVKKAGLGTFGATNVALKKSLWMTHLFDENYGAGGEDTMWADWAIDEGYQIIFNCKFAVRHTHGLGLLRILKQIRYYKGLLKPQKFDRKKLDYRKEYGNV